MSSFAFKSLSLENSVSVPTETMDEIDEVRGDPINCTRGIR